MARVRSPEKRSAILQSAVHEIAEVGLGAPTAMIAKRAGVAAGTLFTYFASKEELLNELYLELKGQVYARINADFPHKRESGAPRAAHMVELSRLGDRISREAKSLVAVECIRPDHSGNTRENSGGARHN